MERRKPIAVAMAVGILSLVATTANGHDGIAQESNTRLALDRYGATLTYVHGRHTHYRHGHRHYRYSHRHRGHRYHGRRYRTYWYYDGYRYRPYRRYYRY